jgi:hypothetical protein
VILECTVGRLALGLVFFFFGCNKTPRTGTGGLHTAMSECLKPN